MVRCRGFRESLGSTPYLVAAHCRQRKRRGQTRLNLYSFREVKRKKRRNGLNNVTHKSPLGFEVGVPRVYDHTYNTSRQALDVDIIDIDDDNCAFTRMYAECRRLEVGRMLIHDSGRMPDGHWHTTSETAAILLTVHVATERVAIRRRYPRASLPSIE